MNAFLAAVFVTVAIGVGAHFALDSLGMSSAAATASESVRLD
jgi:hypothetical protein